jgi:hypothetical protein
MLVWLFKPEDSNIPRMCACLICPKEWVKFDIVLLYLTEDTLNISEGIFFTEVSQMGPQDTYMMPFDLFYSALICTLDFPQDKRPSSLQLHAARRVEESTPVVLLRSQEPGDETEAQINCSGGRRTGEAPGTST